MMAQLFVTLMFCSGLPLLILCYCNYCFLGVTVDKIVLAYVARKVRVRIEPPRRDGCVLLTSVRSVVWLRCDTHTSRAESTRLLLI